MVIQHVPDFEDHQAVFLRFLELRDEDSVEIYVEHFGQGIFRDREFLKVAIQRDRSACFFQNMSLELRSDPELLRLAVEHVLDSKLRALVAAIPPPVLLEHEFVISRALERGAVYLDDDQIPRSYWSKREFFLKWAETKRWFPLSCMTKEFREDREICLTLYRSRYNQLSDIIMLISNTLLEDKEFIIDCLLEHPAMFEYCDDELQSDFDVLLAAACGAVRVDKLNDFIHNELGESFVPFATSVRHRITAHDEFLTFLACWSKSRQSSVPLNVLYCDEATARGLQMMVAKYLGFPTTAGLVRLRRVWDGIVLSGVRSGNIPNTLMRLIPHQDLSQAILAAIESGRSVVLENFPDELWTNRTFVLWAATNGKFHEAILAAFAEDRDICLAYYQHSPVIRQKVLPWISGSLKSDREFILDCLNSDPAILAYCTTDDIRYDYQVLFSVVHHAANNAQLDSLAETALAGGWADSLIFFAKLLRDKIEAEYGFYAFEAQLDKSYHDIVNLRSGGIMLKEGVRSYLGLCTNAKELVDLNRIWNNRSIFFLALGGNIEDLCKATRFRAEQHQQLDEFGRVRPPEQRAYSWNLW